MNSYLLHNDSHQLDVTLERELGKNKLYVEHVKLPADHEEVITLFGKRDTGIIFIPPVWEDLFCVKVINEIETLKVPFEIVLVGQPPSMPNLIVAFNNGLGAYLEIPVDADKLRQAILRSTAKLRKRVEHMQLELRLAEYGSGLALQYSIGRVTERDQVIARALLDFMRQTGPIQSGEVQILLVNSSTAQERKLEGFLKEVGIGVTSAGSVEEAIKLAESGGFRLIISDGLLPDGDAIELVNRLRKVLKENMPRFLVWSSSPGRISSLLDPANHIDDILVKPDPATGIESVLPSIVAGIYQTQA